MGYTEREKDSLHSTFLCRKLLPRHGPNDHYSALEPTTGESPELIPVAGPLMDAYAHSPYAYWPHTTITPPPSETWGYTGRGEDSHQVLNSTNLDLLDGNDTSGSSSNYMRVEPAAETSATSMPIPMHDPSPPNHLHHQESPQDTQFPNATVAPASLSYTVGTSNVSTNGTDQAPAGICKDDHPQQLIVAIAFTREYLRRFFGREPTLQLIIKVIQNLESVRNVGGN